MKRIIDDNREGYVVLSVFNCKCGNYRDVNIHPTLTWGGQSLLGMTIRFDEAHRECGNLHVVVYFIYI